METGNQGGVDMYNILQDGAVIGTCDSITHIKTGKNGTYRVCGPNQADNSTIL